MSDHEAHDPMAGFVPEALPDRPTPAREGEPVEQARRFTIEAARLLHDSHCEDVLVLDVRGLSELMDFIVIASGTSDRQIKAVAGHVADLGREMNFQRYGSDRDEARRWVVMDFVEVMVHLFEPETRAHYDLEMMWGDAPRIPWRRDT